MDQEHSLTLPELTTAMSTDVDEYRERLVIARVKTKEDLQKMTDEDVKKLYLKHEQDLIDRMADQWREVSVKVYTRLVSKVLPLEDEDKLEQSLNKDVFLTAALKEAFIPFYYRWGACIAPVSVLATTAGHVDYGRLKSKNLFRLKNDKDEKSDENQTSRGIDEHSDE